MKYYIENPKNRLFTILEVTHRLEIKIYKQIYPTYKFIRVDNTLHGQKLLFDPFYKRNFICELKGE